MNRIPLASGPVRFEHDAVTRKPTAHYIIIAHRIADFNPLWYNGYMVPVKITLPFPPSVNALYGGGSGQKRFPSKKYKLWLASCPELSQDNISRPVTVCYTFAWPDRRVRDGQNYMKAVLDYLVNQGVLHDDNWDIVVSETWSHVGVDKKNPRVEVAISYVE